MEAGDGNNNNINDFICTNTLKDQAQWRYKTKGLSYLIIVNSAGQEQTLVERNRKHKTSIQAFDGHRETNDKHNNGCNSDVFFPEGMQLYRPQSQKKLTQLEVCE